jgi:predicted DNA-binding protein (MmcQ/YjbR family)
LKTDLESIYAFCLAKKGATASYPFGEGTLVFKVMGKMFALISENENPLRMNLKCDPDDARALRAQHQAIIPGYHMNKRHWNSLYLDGSLSGELVAELIDQSYDLVVKVLKRTKKEELAAMA